MRASFVLLFAIAALVIGCSSTTRQQAWCSAQGGLLIDAHQRRAEAVASRFSASFSVLPPVHVLNSECVGAYGWPDGNIFVTRGLMDLLSDDELAAAIAHEMGHLLADGHLRSVVGLNGCCKEPDAEARADGVGFELLENRGIPAHAMIDMLQKFRNALVSSPSCQQAIGHRIELLKARAQAEHES